MLAELFQDMMEKGQYMRLSHLTKSDGAAHPLSEKYVKSQYLLAWYNVCQMKYKGQRQGYPYAVRLGDDKRIPVLEVDKDGQIIKPDPYEPEGSVIGRRNR